MELTVSQVIFILSGLLGGGVGVSIVFQGIKKFARWRGVTSDAVIHTMVVAVSFVAAATQYVLMLKTKLPPEVLGISFTSMYGVSQVVFKYSKYVRGFLDKVNAYNSSKKLSAAQPVADVPESTPPPFPI
jgi:hypothetical protein